MPFLIASRFQGVSPADVDEWPAQLVEDAIERIRAEGEWQEEQDAADKRRAKAEAAGDVVLDDKFPDLEE